MSKHYNSQKLGPKQAGIQLSRLGMKGTSAQLPCPAWLNVADDSCERLLAVSSDLVKAV